MPEMWGMAGSWTDATGKAATAERQTAMHNAATARR